MITITEKAQAHKTALKDSPKLKTQAASMSSEERPQYASHFSALESIAEKSASATQTQWDGLCQP